MNNKIRKAALVCYSLKLGGAEKHTIEIQQILKSRGIKSDIYIFDKTNDYKQSAIVIGNRLPKVLDFFIGFYRLLQQVRNNKYNILIATLEYLPLYVCALISLTTKIPFVFIAGTSFQKNYSKNIILRLLRRSLLIPALHKAHIVIAVSKGLKNELIKSFGIPETKINLIYQSPPVEKSYRIKKEPYLIASMGRLNTEKNFPLLIRSFFLLKSHEPKAKLLIIGDGPEKLKLNRLIQRLYLENYVSITGFIQHPNLLLARSSIFVNTSRHEAFGRSILEAMQQANAIVSVRGGYGPGELTENGNYGFLVAATANEISKALYLLMSDNKSALKYQRLALRRSRAFRYNKMAQLYIRAITSLNGI